MKKLSMLSVCLFVCLLFASCKKENIELSTLRRAKIHITFNDNSVIVLPIKLYAGISLHLGHLNFIPDFNCPASYDACKTLLWNNVKSYRLDNEVYMNCPK